MGTVLKAQQSEPALYGLVNSKTLVNETDRWISGFEQESVACRANVDLLDTCNNGLSIRSIGASGSGSIPAYTPFTVQATVKCSTMGKQEDWEAFALQALEECQNKAIEKEFWEGALTRAVVAEDNELEPNRFLANGDAVDITPTPGSAVKVRYGLALLEGKLAATGCGSRGVIHVPTSVGSVLALKDRDGDGVLTTTMGNYVIPGSGYTGTGTNGAPTAGNAVWLYVTGPVYVRLGEAEIVADQRQSINTANNTVEVKAERPVSVVWDGCAHFKVLVDLSLDY